MSSTPRLVNQRKVKLQRQTPLLLLLLLPRRSACRAMLLPTAPHS